MPNAVRGVTTAAAADDNPELVEARRREIPLLLRAEMVARLMAGKRVIAVAGAHGKTTTSSMIAYILVQAGRQPMYLLGGESIDLGPGDHIVHASTEAVVLEVAGQRHELPGDHALRARSDAWTDCLVVSGRALVGSVYPMRR